MFGHSTPRHEPLNPQRFASRRRFRLARTLQTILLLVIFGLLGAPGAGWADPPPATNGSYTPTTANRADGSRVPAQYPKDSNSNDWVTPVERQSQPRSLESPPRASWSLYIHDGSPTGVWGTTSTAYWEAMNSTAPTGAASGTLLLPDTTTAFSPYYAYGPTETTDYWYVDFEAKLWLKNSVANRTAKVTVQLRQGTLGGEGTLIRTASRNVSTTTWTQFTFDFGVLCPELENQRLILKIIYDPGEVHPGTRIRWDGGSYASGLFGTETTPPEIVFESEPICHTDYIDSYNGGCNSNPVCFQPIQRSSMCPLVAFHGTSGTYIANDMATRDTDWLEFSLYQPWSGVFRCLPQFRVLFALLDGNQGCDNVEMIEYVTGEPGEMVDLDVSLDPGTYWLWVGPAEFEGVECGAEYELEIPELPPLESPPPPDVHACCLAGACYVTSEAGCVELGGTWFADHADCDPNPCRYEWADHNVGDCVLSVTDQGILGFMDGAQSEGSGFIYPADGSNLLYVGSLWVGADETYIANRDYDDDPAKEWTVATHPDGRIWVDYQGTSHQDLHACFTDSAAASPRGLVVHQDSWAFATNRVATDLVILRYTIRNAGSAPLNSLYVGEFLDLDFEAYWATTGGVEGDRNLVYMTSPAGLYAGVALLREDVRIEDPPLANLTLVDNPTFVHPNGYVLDADKMGLLSASGPEYVMTEGSTPADYGVLASAGPIDLAPNEERVIVFAVVAAESLEDLRMYAHVADLIFEEGFADASEDPAPVLAAPHLLSSRPNPFMRETLIRFDLPRATETCVNIFDVAGRRVRNLVDGTRPAGHNALLWDGRDDAGRMSPPGVYFIRLDAGETHGAGRLIRLR